LRKIALWKMEGYTDEEIAAGLRYVPRTVRRKVRQIRSLWGQGARAMSETSRSISAGLPSALAEQVNRVCDQFEAAWQAGQRPRIEDHLGEAPDPARAYLLRELIALDVAFRLRQGEAPRSADYHARFPEVDPAWLPTRFESVPPTPPSSLTATAPFLPPCGAEPSTVTDQRTPGDVPGPGTVMGDYELIDELGHGGMGVVYRARQRSADRIVALKVVRAERLKEHRPERRQEWLERFRREAPIAARLEHDHIVSVYEVGVLGGQPFYSMRLIFYGVAFSPDGRRIVTGGRDRLVILWDAMTGQKIFDLRGHAGPVKSVAFSPDGRWIASAGVDQTVRVWDATTGREALVLRGHTDTVNGVAFTPDSKRLASAGDLTIKIWDPVTGLEVITLRGHSRHVNGAAFSPDGRLVVSGSGDGTVKIWDATPLDTKPVRTDRNPEAEAAR
jgi:hypothetical protein